MVGNHKDAVYVFLLLFKKKKKKIRKKKKDPCKRMRMIKNVSHTKLCYCIKNKSTEF